MQETMGQIIRRLRKDRGLTQDELAEQLNVTFQAVSKWENDAGMPDISQVVPLANVLGVSTDTLFGKSGIMSDEETEAFILEIERKLCNAPDDVSPYALFRECCTDVLAKLKLCPNNYRLLAYSIGLILGLLDEYDDEIEDREGEQRFWQDECIREANVILHNCTNVDHLNSANYWLMMLYGKLGDTKKSEEHAKKLPLDCSTMSRRGWLAEIYMNTGRTDEALRECGQGIFSAFNYLDNALQQIACVYRHMGDDEKAYACYRLYPDIYDLMHADIGDDAPYYIYPCYDQLAEVCMNLGRGDEAMDWLEKYLKHEKWNEKNYNVITKSSMPWFCGEELKYSSETYHGAGRVTSVLGLPCFAPIRENPRFKALEEAVAEFEKG